MALTLYTYPSNFRCFKILIAAEYNGLEIEVPAFEMFKDNLTAEFKAMSPLSKVPVLKTPQVGVRVCGWVWEGRGVCESVCRLCGLS